MQKSSSQKALKVVSIIMIVFAGLTLALSLLTLVGGAGMSYVGVGAADDDAMFAAGLVLVAGIIMFVGGAFNLIVGIFGVRGANDPRKIGVFYFLSIISIVLAVINGAISFMGSTMDLGTITSVLCGLILPTACCTLAYSIKKENNL